ncbi:MAG: DUF2249 domain-containing protein [Candidatus Marinimicrobia bacterium]|jgi:uncharacterized protein (DUF2249 family)|nr:DUF2249 domain-containing protein [Candidatus Neomarinimicrobiota bacterium]MBT4361501.1 DUF2249 domain-containing protein [Candidatus Neomarinimicrobiota bacterium]MBT4713939.1 DUF2249 domain-containing protein [Candidatus Neomarinimicrobiota bacterium]MBT4946462.1 DUF2249 domain-containing protein [Candidatus Neomarinimicrobiota bacterium]MBT5269546.1 DUF2249 domain-containing protein [Candidatus Neomarinimicrobiota bacterium]
MNEINHANLITLDVRAGLKQGIDPFTEIMAAVKQMSDDKTLQIINTFEPIPLINKLKTMGYESWTERPEPGVIHTYYKKVQSNVQVEDVSENLTPNEQDFQQQLESFCNKTQTLDVRHLEMPEPMVEILKALESLPENHALFVDHKKMPQFLFPELKDRNYSIVANEIDSNHIQLLIYKSTSS